MRQKITTSKVTFSWHFPAPWQENNLCHFPCVFRQAIMSFARRDYSVAKIFWISSALVKYLQKLLANPRQSSVFLLDCRQDPWLLHTFFPDNLERNWRNPSLNKPDTELQTKTPIYRALHFKHDVRYIWSRWNCTRVWNESSNLLVFFEKYLMQFEPSRSSSLTKITKSLQICILLHSNNIFFEIWVLYSDSASKNTYIMNCLGFLRVWEEGEKYDLQLCTFATLC